LKFLINPCSQIRSKYSYLPVQADQALSKPVAESEVKGPVLHVFSSLLMWTSWLLILADWYETIISVGATGPILHPSS
jgi:hypothetical protein